MGHFLSRDRSGSEGEKDVEYTGTKDVLPVHEPSQPHATAALPHKEAQDKPKEVDVFWYDTSKLSEEQLLRVKNWGDAIQPHTDEGGDAYYIGDAYEKINKTCADEWRIHEEIPYLQYVKHLSKTLPHLEYLAHWMEVSAAPPKWRFLRKQPERRAERAKKTKVRVIDYATGRAPSSEPYHTDSEPYFTDTAVLQRALEAAQKNQYQPEARLIIVEDLCRDLVAMLGEFYDIDPLFFLSHIGDYLFHNTRDRWVELPNLEVDRRGQSHFNLEYLRPRYFKTEEQFNDAEFQSGCFNALRRLDSDRSRKRLQEGLLDWKGASVTLTRAKTSLWLQPKQDGQPLTAILLVDPTVTTGYPLWGGYRPFEQTPSMRTWREQPTTEVDAPKRQSLFEDVVYWSMRISDTDIERMLQEPKYIAFPMYRLVTADWLNVLKYMTTTLGKIEWEFETPHWGEKPSDIDSLLKKLSPWRRNIEYYQGMIANAMLRLFADVDTVQPSGSSRPGDTTPDFTCPVPFDQSGVASLWRDFRKVKTQMNQSQARIKSIEINATNTINIEESRRAVKQNKNLARLTFLATIFIPLSFTSQFLSMSPNFTASNNRTFWLFFAIGIPMTIVAIIIVDLTHPNRNGKLQKFYRKHFKDNKKKSNSKSKKPWPGSESEVVSRTGTIPWLNTRHGSTFRRKK